MTDTNQNESKAPEEPKDTCSTFSCCDFGKMGEMMQNFCGSKDGGFDCEAMMGMMQKMFTGFEKKP
jgi:hypothetical protein